MKAIVILLMCSMMCNAQCFTQFFGMKYSQLNVISLNAAQLNTNQSYSGIQGKLPLFGDESFFMNAELGKGIKINKIGLIGYGIAGLYVPDMNVWCFNYGLGIQSYYKNIFIGMNYTNRELLSIKLGICFSYSCTLNK